MVDVVGGLCMGAALLGAAGPILGVVVGSLDRGTDSGWGATRQISLWETAIIARKAVDGSCGALIADTFVGTGTDFGSGG